jgi:hypothetical protein
MEKNIKKLMWFLDRTFSRKKGYLNKHVIDLLSEKRGNNVYGMDELRSRVERLSLGDTYIKEDDELIDQLLDGNKASGTYIKCGKGKLMFYPLSL